MDIVIGGVAKAVIVINGNASREEKIAAGELNTYIKKITGIELEITGLSAANKINNKNLIILGKVDNNKLISEVYKSKGYRIGEELDSFFIISEKNSKQEIILIGGHKNLDVLYAAYTFLEEIGVTFLLNDDLIPKYTRDLTSPKIDKVFKTSFRKRGIIRAFINLNCSIDSLSDYKHLLDQMAKMKLNYLNFYVSVCEPWIEYYLRGEKNLIGDVTSKESGYLRLKLSLPNIKTDQIKIGSRHFKNRKYMAPLEMQEINSQEQAHKIFSFMMKEVFKYAHSKGIKIGLTIDPSYMPPNFGRFAKNFWGRPFEPVWGSKISPTDPIATEHIKGRLGAIFSTYPEIDDLFISLSEDYFSCKYPESKELYRKLRPKFKEAKKIIENEWDSLCKHKNRTPEQLIDADIGLFYLANKTIKIARQLNPNIKLGICTFFRGYLLKTMDKLLEKSISFMDWQSQGCKPLKSDINANYFEGMGERERIIIPRVDDDGSMFGIPFYLRQYQRDGLFNIANKAGVTGFVAQVTRSRGIEHHTKFLADGAWNPEITIDEFYDNYTNDIFGSKAALFVKKAFNYFEESEELLGWRGLKNFLWSVGLSDLVNIKTEIIEQANPFGGPENPTKMIKEMKIKEDIFSNGIELLQKGMKELKKAKFSIGPKGKEMLDYLINRTEAYIFHLSSVKLLYSGFLIYAEAFADDGFNKNQLGKKMENVLQVFIKSKLKIKKATSKFSEIIDHNSDLAVLFLENIWGIGELDKLVRFFKQVVNYYNGRNYWADDTYGDSAKMFSLVKLRKSLQEYEGDNTFLSNTTIIKRAKK